MVNNQDYPRAPNTTTVALLYKEPDMLEPLILIGWRTDDASAYPGYPCLPGGFLNIPEKSIIAASRETQEETGLQIDPYQWNLFWVDDTPGDDPRYDQVVNICYWFNVNQKEYNQVQAGDDLKALKWVSLNKAKHMKLAFNHNNILEELQNHI